MALSVWLVSRLNSWTQKPSASLCLTRVSHSVWLRKRRWTKPPPAPMPSSLSQSIRKSSKLPRMRKRSLSRLMQSLWHRRRIFLRSSILWIWRDQKELRRQVQQAKHYKRAFRLTKDFWPLVMSSLRLLMRRKSQLARHSSHIETLSWHVSCRTVLVETRAQLWLLACRLSSLITRRRSQPSSMRPGLETLKISLSWTEMQIQCWLRHSEIR